MEASTARTQARSIISSAAGTIPVPMMADTASLAARTVGKSASMVRTLEGIGSSRTTISVAIPNMPSLPTKRPTRSGPHASPWREPSRTTEASGSTTSSSITWFVVTPYLRQWGPPAFSATLPPTVQAAWLDGSGTYCSP
jgi:hypothetical protein